MKLTVDVNMSNAAFQEDATELARVMMDAFLKSSQAVNFMLSHENWGYSEEGKLRDINGNTVGKWTIDLEEMR